MSQNKQVSTVTEYFCIDCIDFRGDFSSLSEEQKLRSVVKAMDKILLEVSGNVPSRSPLLMSQGPFIIIRQKSGGMLTKQTANHVSATCPRGRWFSRPLACSSRAFDYPSGGKRETSRNLRSRQKFKEVVP